MNEQNEVREMKKTKKERLRDDPTFPYVVIFMGMFISIIVALILYFIEVI